MSKKNDTKVFDDVADADMLEDSVATKAATDAAPVNQKEVVLDTKDEKEGWPVIYVDEESGESNYVPVGHNGIVYQVMRGVEVSVPQKVVDVLKDAVAHRVVQVVDPRTGNKENVMRPYNAIPFRVIRP